MMQAVVFEVQNFRNGNWPEELRYSVDRMNALFNGLVNANELHLRQARLAGRPYPALYKSGMRYEREVGTENWQDIPTCLGKGFGDCEDLAAYRIAELRDWNHGRIKAARVAGNAALAGAFERFRADPFISWRTDPVSGAYHCHAIVDRLEPTGRRWIEDPSKKCGMGWEDEYARRNHATLINPPRGPAPTEHPTFNELAAGGIVGHAIGGCP